MSDLIAPQLDKRYTHGCVGKKRYDTKIQAERMGKAVAWANNETHDVHAYACPFCQGFHWGRHHRKRETDQHG